MKKLFILSIFFSLFTFSCVDDFEPMPEPIRAYCNLFHFIPELSSVIWEADEVEVPDENLYAINFAGSIILDSASEVIPFTIKHVETKEVLASENFQLEKDKFYNIIACGTKEDPSLFIREIDTSHPQTANVKIQFLHSAAGKNSIDLYMGGTTPEKKVVSELDYLDLTTPFEASADDAWSAIIASNHSEEYNQDSVLLSSFYNEEFISGYNYLTVLANSTYEPSSELTFWYYFLPLE